MPIDCEQNILRNTRCIWVNQYLTKFEKTGIVQIFYFDRSNSLNVYCCSIKSSLLLCIERIAGFNTDQSMHVFVKSLSGETVAYEVEENDTVESVKTKIQVFTTIT